MQLSGMPRTISVSAIILAATIGQALAATTTKPFSYYPAFVKRHAVVEAATDKGLMVELIVRCPSGAGIVTYSKVERLYCGPKLTCDHSLKAAVNRLCK